MCVVVLSKFVLGVGFYSCLGCWTTVKGYVLYRVLILVCCALF
jgi:hypothetical protein